MVLGFGARVRKSSNAVTHSQCMALHLNTQASQVLVSRPTTSLQTIHEWLNLPVPVLVWACLGVVLVVLLWRGFGGFV